MSMTCGRPFSACSASLPVLRKIGSARHQAFVFIGIERCQCRGAGDRMAGIGIAVEQLDHVFRASHERFIDLLRSEDRAHRDHTAGNALGRGYEVGNDAEIIDRKRRTKTAETGDDLVEDQQYVVLGADLAQALQVTLRRDEHTGRSGHRLDDNRSDVGGIVQGDNLFQIIGKLDTIFRLAARVGIARRIVRMAD